jgi:hypothetical protein
MNNSEKKINPTDLANLVSDLQSVLEMIPSKEALWMKIIQSIRDEEEKLTKLIYIKIDMSAKFYEVSDVDFQILFSRIRIKVLKEILNYE